MAETWVYRGGRQEQVPDVMRSGVHRTLLCCPGVLAPGLLRAGDV